MVVRLIRMAQRDYEMGEQEPPENLSIQEPLGRAQLHLRYGRSTSKFTVTIEDVKPEEVSASRLLRAHCSSRRQGAGLT
jgi:hypothetical protein